MPLICAVSTDRVEALSGLHNAAFERGWSSGEVAALLQQPGMICLAAHDRETTAVIGFIMVRAAVDEAEIISLAVAQDRRRQGIGSSLLAEICRRLAEMGIASLFLEVAEDNRAAHDLYTVCGFALTGRRKGYYAMQGQRVDALVMQRALGAASQPASDRKAKHDE